MTKAELREVLAKEHHDWWVRWEKHREEFNTMHMAGTWRRQRDTPYADLEEGVKEFSRAEADRMLEIVWPVVEYAAKKGAEAAMDAFEMGVRAAESTS